MFFIEYECVIGSRIVFKNECRYIFVQYLLNYVLQYILQEIGLGFHAMSKKEAVQWRVWATDLLLFPMPELMMIGIQVARLLFSILHHGICIHFKINLLVASATI